MSVRVGVIGVGNIGQDHIRRLTRNVAGAEVVALSDVDTSRAEAVAQRPAQEFPQRAAREHDAEYQADLANTQATAGQDKRQERQGGGARGGIEHAHRVQESEAPRQSWAASGMRRGPGSNGRSNSRPGSRSGPARRGQ